MYTRDTNSVRQLDGNENQARGEERGGSNPENNSMPVLRIKGFKEFYFL